MYIIPIMTLLYPSSQYRTIMTLITLRHYYTLLLQLQNIMRISTHAIMAIIRIMNVISDIIVS